MKRFLLPIFIFILTAIVYFITSAGKTPYDYFTRLADAFIHGKYWLTENPPWLSELVPAGINKFYVVYPPMPAIIAIPFVSILGINFPQQYLAHLLGAGIVIMAMAISWKIKKNKLLTLWTGILVGFSTIVWFLSSVGSSWYLGQISACFFLALAIYESLTQKRVLLIGIFLGAAFLSRINTIVSLPFIYLIAEEKLRLSSRKIFYLLIAFFPFLVFNFYYNFIRYGVIWDKSYFLLPEILNEQNAWWFKHGVMNISYIPNNIRVAFLSFPKLIERFPYLIPSWAGLAIWITTPAFVYSFWAPLKDFLVKNAWVASIISFLVVAMHGGTGFAQFGYRFAVDFYPFLIFLTIKGVARTGLKWHHWLLLFIGILVNFWGVICINKFGWVSY